MKINSNEKNHIFFWIRHYQRYQPEKTFIFSIDQNINVSYREAYKICCKIGSFLKERKIKANDRIVLLSNNSIEHLLTYFGVMSYGATICTINVEMNQINLNYILERIAPKLVLYENISFLPDTNLDFETLPLGSLSRRIPGSFFEKLDKVSNHDFGLPVNETDDTASIFFTSGTDTKPKGVLISFLNLAKNTIAISERFGIKGEDRILEFRSFNWMSAQVLSGLGSLFNGSSLFIAKKFSVSKFFNWIRTFQATIATGNPTTINMLISRPSSLKHDEIPHLRFLTSSSAPLLVEDWKRFEGLYGIPISQGYGASECGWIAGSNEKNRRLGSVGRPLNYQNVTISDQAGNNLPANVQGMVVIGHTETQNRYFVDDAKIRTDTLGRIVTGDIGYIDEDGFLFLTGREKDLIIIGGINVSPIEIENVIMELTEIVEAAVIGIKEQIYGEEIIAFVVPVADAGLSSDEVLAHCRQKLARVKIPRSIEFIDILPKTERGKLDKKGLKKIWTDSKND